MIHFYYRSNNFFLFDSSTLFHNLTLYVIWNKNDCTPDFRNGPYLLSIFVQLIRSFATPNRLTTLSAIVHRRGINRITGVFLLDGLRNDLSVMVV